MNILLCFNDKFVTFARTLIISLMCHHRDLHFYVGYLNLSEDNRAGLKELVEGNCPSGNWPWDDGSFRKGSVSRTIEFIEFTLPANLRTFGRFSLDTWTRCFVWEQIPVDRLLYLDADIVVDGNIEQFYYDDLGDNLIKACPDYVLYGYGPENKRWANKVAQLKTDHGYANKYGHYCNAGVVLFNLAKMREEQHTSSRFIEYCKKLTKPLRMNDQDFINLYFEGRIKLANPYCYNCEIPPLSYMLPQDFSAFDSINFSEAPFPKEQTYDSQESSRGAKFSPSAIKVYHYSAKAKPNKMGYRHKYAGVFWRYRLMEPGDSSRHSVVRLVQLCWGPLRRLIPDHPLDLLKRHAPAPDG